MPNKISTFKLQEFKYVECKEISTLMDQVKTYIHDKAKLKDIEDAYYYAEKKHKKQLRKSGDPFIIHPLSCAYYLAQWQMGPKTIIAGLLHDVIEDTPVTFEEIETKFGVAVANLVEAVTKVSYFAKENREQMKGKYLRKLFLSMVRDIRVIIIKIADRLHNLLTLEFMRPEKQMIIAKETLDVYSAIANRIGMKSTKNILEDYSFKILNPNEYDRISKLLENDKEARNQAINQIIDELKISFSKEYKLKDVEVFGRSKTIYSIYRKMSVFGKNFNDINDILAIRIICNSIDECYKIMGIIHQKYTPLSGKFKDYIATPKNNLYQSIHTVIANKEGQIFEVQIRSFDMDAVAETGVAAHWRYKENEKNVSVKDRQEEIDKKVDMFTRIIDLEKMISYGEDVDLTIDDFGEDSSDIIEETVKSDFLTPLIYILSPDGNVTTLPFGSSVLDFAYKVHTDIGDKTVGAKINGVFMPINTILNSGEMVDIQTSDKMIPNSKWLKFVITKNARKAITNSLNHQSKIMKVKEENFISKKIRKAKKEVDKYIIENNLKLNVNDMDIIEKKLKVINYNNIDEFLLSVSNGGFTIQEAVELVYTSKENIFDDKDVTNIKIRKFILKNTKSDIIVNDVDNMESELAPCCYALPFEDITGFLSKSKGVQIHRNECINIINLKNNNNKNILSAKWNTKKVKRSYNCKIRIIATDRPGLLKDISKIISRLGCNINEAKLITKDEDYIMKASFLLGVEDINHLNQIVSNIKSLPNITFISRVLANVKNAY